VNSKCQQICEINEVATLLRRNGYSFQDLGTTVVVSDPVHRIVGCKLIQCGTQPVVIRDAAQARKFITARN
jgi:hypothetical protein